MEHHGGSLAFADFRLEIRPNPYIPNEVHRSLYRGDNEVKLPPLQLKLLECLARRSKQRLEESYLSLALRREADDAAGNIEQHISKLREVLGDTDRNNRRFISTIPKFGYMFLPDVRRQGDLGGIEAFLKWHPGRFSDLLKGVDHDDGKQEDLRIVTVAFSPSVQELHLDDILARGGRIKIVMTNPANSQLLEARHGLRKDRFTAREGRDHIIKQLEQLADIRAEFANLEVRLSDAMPCGFVAHSNNWALAGMFPAQGSYVIGPMIEVSADTELWKTLYTDWFVRWEKGIPG